MHHVLALIQQEAHFEHIKRMYRTQVYFSIPKLPTELCFAAMPHPPVARLLGDWCCRLPSFHAQIRAISMNALGASAASVCKCARMQADDAPSNFAYACV